jgi:hypothetical protein
MSYQRYITRFRPGFFPLLTFFTFLILLICIGPGSTQAFAAQVTLAWDANTDPAVAGYKLYHGTASRTYVTPVDVGKVTQYTLTGIEEGRTSYFAVTAYDSNGNESAFSEELAWMPGSWSRLMLWRNASTGENALWFMEGVTRVGADYLPAVTDMNWAIVGAGDFNNDGKPDILWRNASTGENALWFMDGVTRIGADYFPSVPDRNWAIVGSGDFNNDGKSDILWRNASTGENAVWFMDGLTRIGAEYLPSVSDMNWTIVGAGDYNNDGKPDILWRNSSTGENAVWFMDGLTRIGADYFPSVSDMNWAIV